MLPWWEGIVYWGAGWGRRLKHLRKASLAKIVIRLYTILLSKIRICSTKKISLLSALRKKYREKLHNSIKLHYFKWIVTLHKEFFIYLGKITAFTSVYNIWYLCLNCKIIYTELLFLSMSNEDCFQGLHLWEYLLKEASISFIAGKTTPVQQRRDNLQVSFPLWYVWSLLPCLLWRKLDMKCSYNHSNQ